MSKPVRTPLTRFAETTGAKMYATLAADLKRQETIFHKCRPEDAMVALLNTGLLPLVILSRSDMFRNVDADAFAQLLASQFVKLNAVVRKAPEPTRH